jgi:hypothetical protein
MSEKAIVFADLVCRNIPPKLLCTRFLSHRPEKHKKEIGEYFFVVVVILLSMLFGDCGGEFKVGKQVFFFSFSCIIIGVPLGATGRIAVLGLVTFHK